MKICSICKVEAINLGNKLWLCPRCRNYYVEGMTKKEAIASIKITKPIFLDKINPLKKKLIAISQCCDLPINV